MKKLSEVVSTKIDTTREPVTCPYCGKKLYYYVLVRNGEEIPLPGAELCDCEESKRIVREETEAMLQELRRKEELETIEHLFKQSNLGVRFTKRTFEAFDRSKNPKAFDIAYDYAVNFPNYYEEGRGLIFTGPCGTGKTHLAAAIANYLIREHKASVIFGTFSRLLESMRRAYSSDEDIENISYQLGNVKLLIIDDLGKEKLTDWVLETAYEIINTRYENMKPVIITTNFSLKQLEERLNQGNNYIGEALVSRLIEMCNIVLMQGEDYRKQ